MSRRGSDHTPGAQGRPSNQRPPPQAYHEDSYQRSSSYELSDDDISHMRTTRHVRVPGLTPHHDPFRYMPSTSILSPPSFTTRARAGSNVGRNPLDEPFARRQPNDAASGLETEGRNLSWPYRQPAEHRMFPPASTDVCSYPMDIDIAPGPPPRIHDHREPVARPVANRPGAATSDSLPQPRPQVLRPQLERHHTHDKNVRTDLRRQRPKRRLPARSDPSESNDNRNNRPRYND